MKHFFIILTLFTLPLFCMEQSATLPKPPEKPSMIATLKTKSLETMKNNPIGCGCTACCCAVGYCCGCGSTLGIIWGVWSCFANWAHNIEHIQKKHESPALSIELVQKVIGSGCDEDERKEKTMDHEVPENEKKMKKE